MWVWGARVMQVESWSVAGWSSNCTRQARKSWRPRTAHFSLIFTARVVESSYAPATSTVTGGQCCTIFFSSTFRGKGLDFCPTATQQFSAVRCPLQVFATFRDAEGAAGPTPFFWRGGNASGTIYQHSQGRDTTAAPRGGRMAHG